MRSFESDAEAGRYPNGLAEYLDIGIEGGASSMRNLNRISTLDDEWGHDCERVSTVARDYEFRECLGDPAGNFEEHRITESIAKAVVDQIEVVEVQKQELRRTDWRGPAR